MVENRMRYRFGRHELLVGTRELLADGQPCAVEPQVFDLLLHLIDKRERVVTQDELVAAIWNGRIVSDSAISARISAARAAIGDDGTRQQWIKTVPRRGFRFVGEVQVLSASPSSQVPAGIKPPREETPTRQETPSREGAPSRHADRQRVAFCRSADGTRIAYAVSGKNDGYPLIRAGHWLTHLEHDWASPIWRPLLDCFDQRFRLIRYDQRGNGLSDWDSADFSLDRFVEDLEAVVAAAGVERFALYGTSQGAPIAIAYAHRHPQRVSHLVLQGGYEKGRLLRDAEGERAQGEAILTLIRHGWGKPGSAFIRAFASMFVPTADREQIDSLVDLQRLTTSPENAARLRAAVDHFDVSGLVGQISVPTLVIHCRDDGIQPLEQGRQLAARIAHAEFLMLDSANHVLLANEPAAATLFHELDRFILSAHE